MSKKGLNITPNIRKRKLDEASGDTDGNLLQRWAKACKKKFTNWFGSGGEKDINTECELKDVDKVSDMQDKPHNSVHDIVDEMDLPLPESLPVNVEKHIIQDLPIQPFYPEFDDYLCETKPLTQMSEYQNNNKCDAGSNLSSSDEEDATFYNKFFMSGLREIYETDSDEYSGETKSPKTNSFQGNHCEVTVIDADNFIDSINQELFNGKKDFETTCEHETGKNTQTTNEGLTNGSPDPIKMQSHDISKVNSIATLDKLETFAKNSCVTPSTTESEAKSTVLNTEAPNEGLNNGSPDPIKMQKHELLLEIEADTLDKSETFAISIYVTSSATE